MNKFDSKSFNAQVFKYLADKVPNPNKTEMIKSKALKSNPDIRETFSTQGGTGYARLAMRGLADGQAVNYDGNTDIEATSTKTFEQGVVVVGRAKAWMERDFSYDITGGEDFMSNIAEQIATYWAEAEQGLMLKILQGVFNMEGDDRSKEFVDLHTYDVSAADNGLVSETTLNSAMQQACGHNKKKFTLAFVHSTVATNLENLKLIKHLTYTDPEGMTRELELYSWNGRAVIVDDSVTTIEKDGETIYTTYVLGDGAFSYENLGAKVPYEMDRDPKTNGGVDTLYTRSRLVLAPFGISYEKTSQASLSPTDDELMNGANWSLVSSSEEESEERSYVSHKAIPLARILSKG